GGGLEATVRMPRGALGLTRGVVDLAELVHVDEGVEVGRAHSGERPAHGEALALVAGRGRGDLPDRAWDVGETRPGQPWERDGVGGDGGHETYLLGCMCN